MRTVRIDSETQLRTFIEGYRTHGGPVAEMRFLDYLPYCDVSVLVDERGRIVGGWAIAPGAHARILTMLPPAERERVRVELADETTCELNLVWIAPELRGTATASLMWLRIGRQLRDRGVDRIIFAVDRTKTGLVRLYDKIASGVLYEGELDPKLNVEHEFRVCWSTPERMGSMPVIYAREIARRLMKRVVETLPPPRALTG